MPSFFSSQSPEDFIKSHRYPSADDFHRVARDLETAARAIELASRLSGLELSTDEMETARCDAATARRYAATSHSLTLRKRREILRDAGPVVKFVEDRAWNEARRVARLAGDDVSCVPYPDPQGPVMTLIALRAAREHIPQSLQDELLSTAARAEMFMRALAF